MKRSGQRPGRRELCGFNPSVGILVYEARMRLLRPGHVGGFNPSVGILVYEAGFPTPRTFDFNKFQSLGRDSGL